VKFRSRNGQQRDERIHYSHRDVVIDEDPEQILVNRAYHVTITEILDHAKSLSAQERKELAKLLIDTLDIPEAQRIPKTGAEIVTMLQAMEPIEFVDAH
jgi:hypothetical protein